MKTETVLGRVVVTLEHPDDYRQFRHAGVWFERLTVLHDPGVYRATVLQSGREYRVRGGHSKRFPWRANARTLPTGQAFPGDRRAGIYRTLIDAAEGIAAFDAKHYQHGARGHGV